MMSNVPLNALPLFRDVKENLIQQSNEAQRHQHQQHGTGPHHVNRKRSPVKRTSTIHPYMAPLSAYNASEERPYYPDGRFDEMAMRIQMEQKRLDSIRTLGYNYIRPIGIDHTLQASRERKQPSAKLGIEEGVRQEEQINLRRHEQPNQPGRYPDPSVFPSDIQENRDRSSLYEYNGEVDRSGISPPQAQQQASQLMFPPPSTFNPEDQIDDDEEDEISYDYEAEFARVEDEQNGEDEQDEEDVDNEYLDKNQETYLKMMNPRNSMRGNFTIQQFVETSHMGGHPYDIEDGYENPQLEVETNQGDSADFTEVPWANISDAVQSMDSHRISSLNSLITRRMISSSTVTNNNPVRLISSHSRRVSDNNSDQELN